MIETLAGPGAGGVDDLTARDLLALARDRKTAEDRAAAELLVVAARWADLHPPESIHDAAAFTVPGCEHEEPIAGEGAPLVAEFCLAELGTVLGISTTAAKKLVGHALELRHRLPRLWAQVHAGRVPAWRARTVAEVTIHSTPALTRRGCGVRRRPGRRRRRSQSVRRSSTGWSPRPSSGSTSPAPIRPRIRRTVTSTSTRATPRSTPRMCTSPARCGWRPSSTSPTPSTSTAPLATVPPPRPPSAPPSRCRCDARRHSVTWPARRPPSTSTTRAPPGPATPTVCPPPARSCCTPTSTRPSTGWPRCSDRPGGSRRASAWSSSTRSRTGAPTPGRRSP